MPFRSKILRDLVVLGDQLNDPSLLKDVIQIFIEQAPLQIKEVSEALSRSDLAMVSFQTHKLKTSSGVVGSEKLQSLCIEIEKRVSIFEDQSKRSNKNKIKIKNSSAEDILPLVSELQKEVILECSKLLNELDAYRDTKK